MHSKPAHHEHLCCPVHGCAIQLLAAGLEDSLYCITQGGAGQQPAAKTPPE